MFEQNISVTDTIGLNDAKIRTQKVVDIIKTKLKLNLFKIDSVIVLVENIRYEDRAIESIKEMMKDLGYYKDGSFNENNFLFLINKTGSLDCDQIDKLEEDWCTKLDVRH